MHSLGSNAMKKSLGWDLESLKKEMRQTAKQQECQRRRCETQHDKHKKFVLFDDKVGYLQ